MVIRTCHYLYVAVCVHCLHSEWFCSYVSVRVGSVSVESHVMGEELGWHDYIGGRSHTEMHTDGVYWRRISGDRDTPSVEYSHMR